MRKGVKNMTNLVVMKNEQAVTSSLQVAEVFGKQHKHVLEAIENKLSVAENLAQLKMMFKQDLYTAVNGKSNKMYYMNRDGFTFIAFGFTGAKADEFKLKYIEAFNEMEKSLHSQIDFSSLSPELQMFNLLGEALGKQELATRALEGKIKELEAQSNRIKTTSDARLFTTAEIGKPYGLHSRALHQILLDNRIIYYKGGRWRLYASHEHLGLKDSSTLKNSQKWTLKGKHFIENLLNKKVGLDGD